MRLIDVFLVSLIGTLKTGLATTSQQVTLALILRIPSLLKEISRRDLWMNRPIPVAGEL